MKERLILLSVFALFFFLAGSVFVLAVSDARESKGSVSSVGEAPAQQRHDGGIECFDADVDENGFVNSLDLNQTIDKWGNSTQNLPEDVNEDGVVNFPDILYILRHWGPCGGQALG